MKKLALLAILCTAIIIGWRYLKEAEEYLDLYECYLTYYD